MNWSQVISNRSFFFSHFLLFFKTQRIIGSFDDDDDGSRIRNGLLFFRLPTFTSVLRYFFCCLVIVGSISRLASSSKSKLILIQNHLVLVMSQPAILLSRHVFVLLLSLHQPTKRKYLVVTLQWSKESGKC